jgi:hypothetical protein
LRLANAEQGKSNPTMDVEGDPQEWFRLHIKLAPPPVLTCVRARCSLPGPHEIVSLVGTFSSDGTCHLHASFGDAAGRVVGGHVLGDMRVFTTAELVVGDCEGLAFVREFDQCTGAKTRRSGEARARHSGAGGAGFPELTVKRAD